MAMLQFRLPPARGRRSRVTKAMAGHFAKANAGGGRGLWEFRVDEVGEVELGGELSVEQFEAGQIVDVQGTSKGKGYAGTIKRWDWAKTIPTVTRSSPRTGFHRTMPDARARI